MKINSKPSTIKSKPNNYHHPIITPLPTANTTPDSKTYHKNINLDYCWLHPLHNPSIPSITPNQSTSPAVKLSKLVVLHFVLILKVEI